MKAKNIKFSAENSGARWGYVFILSYTWTKQFCNWILEIVKRNDDIKGFQVLPRRWVVERTFGWLNRYRRLSKDYESLPETSESMIYAAMSHLMVKRLSRIQVSR